MSFPPGWRGWLLETFGSKMFEASIEKSLQQLKRAAEARHKAQPDPEENIRR